MKKVSGQTLDKLFDSEIFQPFGMSETQFGPVEVAVPTVKGLREGLFMIPRLEFSKNIQVQQVSFQH